jgi:DNA replication factor GINS
MPIEDDGLTAEEEALFEDLVDRIESNRETVLSALDGEAPTVSCSIDEENPAAGLTESEPATGQPTPESDPAPETDDGVSAADLMGESADATSDSLSPERSPTAPPARESGPTDPEPPSTGAETSSADPTVTGPGAAPPTEPGRGDRSRSEGRSVSKDETAGSETTETAGAESEAENRAVPGLPRTTVRITTDVGEIVGADDRDYELGTEDVVTLPEPNADVLVEKDAAERLQ